MVNVNTNKLLALEIRLHKLKNNGRNGDSPGVIRKLDGDSPGVIRKLEREIRQIKQNGEH